MAIDIKKSLLGKLSVAYDCPKCGERLRSTTNQIGEEDSCPTCESTFFVPGEKELKQHCDKEMAVAERRLHIAAKKTLAVKAKRSKQEQQTTEEFGGNEESGRLRQALATDARRIGGLVVVILFAVFILISTLADPGGSTPIPGERLRSLPAVPSPLISDIPLPQPENPPLPDGVSYEIISEEVIPKLKRSVDIRLNQRVSKDALTQIAFALKDSEAKSFEKTFIGYYLPDMKVNAGYWATTYFTPDLEVRVIGLTADDAEKLATQLPSQDRDEIGRWLDESAFNKRVTIFRKDDKLYMEDAYQDGSVGVSEIRERASPIGRRFDKLIKSPAGDHWILDSSGDLQSYDDEGIISTAKKI